MRAIFCGLSHGDAVFKARDHVAAPMPRIAIGEVLVGEAQRHPELHGMQRSRLKREVKAPRHDADDGVGLAIEGDGTSQDARVAVKAV